jgi:predicted GIY-YIG superfamily endonuclease
MEEINEKLWCVYMHKNKTNGKVYIGITSRDVKDRWGLDGSGYGEQ